jgi:hypothetical protein
MQNFSVEYEYEGGQGGEGCAKVPGLVHNVSAAPFPNFLGFRVMLARGTTAGSCGCGFWADGTLLRLRR